MNSRVDQVLTACHPLGFLVTSTLFSLDKRAFCHSLCSLAHIALIEMGCFKNCFGPKKKDEGSSKKDQKVAKRGKKGQGLTKTVTPSPAATSRKGANRQGSFTYSIRTEGNSNSSLEREVEFRNFDKQTRGVSPRNNDRFGRPGTDTMKSQVAAPYDENLDHSNAATSASPRLSHQQLQHFERKQSDNGALSPSQETPTSQQPMYTMPDEIPKQQMQAMDDMNRSDASSSSFNLSTDAEDSEYEHLRRQGVLPPVATPRKESSINQAQGLLVPLSTPDDAPGRKTEIEDDPRAWSTSAEVASNKLASARSTSSNQGFSFQGSTLQSEFTEWPESPTTSRNTPGSANRNFTSPRSQTSSNTGNSDFGNFADFSKFPTTPDIQPWNEQSSPMTSPRESFTPRSAASSSISASNQQDSSLSELLAQAKNKSRRRSRSGRGAKVSSASVSSAPAITSSYLRQQHNLGKYSNSGYSDRSDRDGRSSNEETSVSDIIQSLEATNQSRKTSGRKSYTNRSVGDSSAMDTARKVKERLRENRRKERESNGSMAGHRARSSEISSSENSDNEASESWLFDEVTGAMGPRGIAADLESLSGRSSRSNKSNRSRSRRSRSRRNRSSNESVDSRGSRLSRSSRYSQRSTTSFLSQMSEQSRSVANDLLRLEMQLAMVGASQENRDDIPVRGGGPVTGTSISIGGTSRASRTNPKSPSSNRTHSHSTTTARRTKSTVVAPPGKLGIILANKADSKGTVVSGVRNTSVLVEKISPGDRIIAIDGEDVSRMTVSEITTIMSRKSGYDRVLTVLALPKHYSVSTESMQSMSHRSPAKASVDQFDNTFRQYGR